MQFCSKPGNICVSLVQVKNEDAYYCFYHHHEALKRLNWEAWRGPSSANLEVLHSFLGCYGVSFGVGQLVNPSFILHAVHLYRRAAVSVFWAGYCWCSRCSPCAVNRCSSRRKCVPRPWLWPVCVPADFKLWPRDNWVFCSLEPHRNVPVFLEDCIWENLVWKLVLKAPHPPVFPQDVILSPAPLLERNSPPEISLACPQEYYAKETNMWDMLS